MTNNRTNVYAYFQPYWKSAAIQNLLKFLFTGCNQMKCANTSDPGYYTVAPDLMYFYANFIHYLPEEKKNSILL